MDIKDDKICAGCKEPEMTADGIGDPLWTLLVARPAGLPSVHAHMACMTREEREFLTTFFNSLLPPSSLLVQTPEEALGILARELDQFAESTDAMEATADAGLFLPGGAEGMR
jgi:hypothetical protein